LLSSFMQERDLILRVTRNIARLRNPIQLTCITKQL
jgi:hypothetical protein